MNYGRLWMLKFTMVYFFETKINDLNNFNGQFCEMLDLYLYKIRLSEIIEQIIMKFIIY